MGAHKYNPIAKLAAEGKLPPKPYKLTRKQRDMLIQYEIQSMVAQKIFGSALKLKGEMDDEHYGY